MPCNCKDWKPNIEIINGIIDMQTHMAWGNKDGYQGKPFVYCPWCGSKLTVEVPEITHKEENMKKVAAVGITDLDLLEGCFPIAAGDKLQFRGKTVKAEFTLPGKPKWMRDDNGKIIPFPEAKGVPVLLYEIACNPLVPMKQQKGGFDALRQSVHDKAALWLKKEDAKQDGEMLKKCKWICKVYRSRSMFLPADEKGMVGVSAFHILGMIGG